MRTKKSPKNKKKWTSFRHRVIRDVLFPLIYPYMRIKYNVKVEKFKEQRRKYLLYKE